jgi:putative toxin-antitoxin system antitoxin component (TIGR02293 family)
MEAVKLHQNAQIDRVVKEFILKIDKQSGYKLLNKNISYTTFLKNKMLLVHAIREGITFDFFLLIKERTPFNEEDWASFLGISTKSLQRGKAKDSFVFKPIQSEKIFELAEVTQLGNEVFDNEATFYSWLNTPSFALDNNKPIELLKDSYGKEMVINELNKIDYGIFV